MFLVVVILVSSISVAQAGESEIRLAEMLNALTEKNPIVYVLLNALKYQLPIEVANSYRVCEGTLKKFEYAIYYTTDVNGENLNVEGKTTADWGDTLRFFPGNRPMGSVRIAEEAFIKSLPLFILTEAIKDLIEFLRRPEFQGKKFLIGVESGLSEAKEGNQFVNHVVVVKVLSS